MSGAAPTTRASRSRFASPAVGTGTRNTKDGGKTRNKGADKDKEKDKDREKDNTNSAARSSSTERSRRFMENWIEPDRARLASFQEDGLIRQGVLETMEPLGTRPKPAMIKKLVGIGREGSPTPSARGKFGGKKIVLKRKNENGTASSIGKKNTGIASGTQSPTPAPSTMVATPRAAVSPMSTPAPTVLAEASPLLLPPRENTPTPTLVTETPAPTIPHLSSDPPSGQNKPSNHTPEPPISQPRTQYCSHDQLSLTRPPVSIPILLPVATYASSSTNPFLPDPIKQSIEESHPLTNIPTTPRSIASTYDTDDSFKRESSVQSMSHLSMPSKRPIGIKAADRLRSTSIVDPDEEQAASGPASTDDVDSHMQQLAPQRTGPIYIMSELARIVEHKEVVKTAIEKGVEEALKHYQYVDAWALRFMYDDKEGDARFLLLTEAVFTQTATRQAVGEWARELHAFKVLGMKNNTALKHFVPEARIDKGYKPHQPLQAEHGDLITMDLSEVRDPSNYKDKDKPQDGADVIQEFESPNQMQAAVQQPRGGVLQAEAEAEAERGRVATPPRKRQKISSRDSSAVRKASTSARASTMNGNVNGDKLVVSPLRRRNRAGSNDSDLSSLSTLRSITPSPEPELPAGASSAAAAAAGRGAVAVRTERSTDVDNDVHTQEGLGVAEATVTNGTSEAAPDEAAVPAQPIAAGRRRAPARRGRQNNLPPGPDPSSNSNTTNPNSNSTNSHSHSFGTDTPNANFTAATPTPTSAQAKQPTKKSRRGMPDFTPQYRLDESDEGTERRRMARNTTLRLTAEARVKGDSFTRNEPIDAPSPPERPASSQSSLSSLPEVDEPELPEPEPVAQTTTRAAPSSARATRSAKRTHDEVDDDATPFSLDFPAEAGPSTVVTSSRPGTPRPNKKQRTGGRRVKQSPVKNKTASSAGVPRGGNRGSPGLNGVPNNQEENDDFCSSCGGNGDLVCCDGCTRAFHQNCHDPVVDPNDDSEWYCHDCTVKRDPSKIGVYSGPFGDLMTNLDKKYATSYRLPKKLREYFEGVRTGVDGEYEEFVPPTKGKKKKDEPKAQEEDFYAIVDKDNKPIFCHSCHKSVGISRPIMPCSICSLYWHMDCLDPPRSNLPNPRTFVCPCHVDDLLLKVPAQMGPAHKFRKVKGSSEIHYAFRRGNINNGWIAVEDDESEGEGRISFRDPGSYGRSYRVRSSGLKQDFISKIGGHNRTRVASTRKRKHQTQIPKPQLPSLDYREDAEECYEAALNMMALSRRARDDHGGKIVDLISAKSGVPTESDKHISNRMIEAASNAELREMQAELEKMNLKIRAQLQKRYEHEAAHEVTPQPLFSASRRASPDAGQQNDSGIKVPTSEKLDSTDDLPIVLEANNTDSTAVLEETRSNSAIVDVKEPTQAYVNNEITKDSRFIAAELSTPATARGPYNETESVPSLSIHEETTAVKPTIDTVADLPYSVDKLVQLPDAQTTVDSALTPVSDLVKDNNSLSPEASNVKPILNDIDTPETNIPDQATSPVEAQDMDLD